MSGTTHHHSQVDEWKHKRDALLIQMADLPSLVVAYGQRKRSPNPDNPMVSFVDAAPSIRLSNACEATANLLYSISEIAANFANKATKGIVPSSFNGLRNKCSNATDGPLVAIRDALGDLQWYSKVRELRTEWAHYSSIFIGEDHAGSPIICLRAYRRKSDQIEFRSPNFNFSPADLIQWTTNALSTLDSFAGHLLQRYVIPTFDLDGVVTIPKYDKSGFPIFRPNATIETEVVTIREFLRRGGIKI